MAEQGKIEELTESLKHFITINYEVTKLEAVERSSSIGSSAISGLVVGFVMIFFLFFISLGIGFYLSEQLGNSYAGFAITAGFYFLIGLILLLTRKSLIENPLRNKIIKKALNSNPQN